MFFRRSKSRYSARQDGGRADGGHTRCSTTLQRQILFASLWSRSGDRTGSSLGQAHDYSSSLQAFPAQSCAVNELCCGILRSASSSGSGTQVGDLDLAAQLGLLDWGRSVWGRSIWPLGCGRLIGAFDLAARSGAFGWVRSIWPLCGGSCSVGAVRSGRSIGAARLGRPIWPLDWGRSMGPFDWGRHGVWLSCGCHVFRVFRCDLRLLPES